MNKKGFTLLETIVGISIFLIITGSLFGLTQILLENIGQTRVRHTARLLAAEKMEEARNLSYDSLGTQGGIPAGPIQQSQTVALGGNDFKIQTTISYIDDPYDGKAPTDTLSADYKRVRIAVSWEGLFPSGNRPVILVTDVSPKGIETTSGGGTLSIVVFDSTGVAVSGADVLIVNTSIDPSINLNLTTDSFGRVILPGSPESIEGYIVIVTKANYSIDRTYGSEEVTNPSKPHLTVLEGEVTEASFAIDKISSLDITTASPNIDLRIYGEKLIGTDANENEIYKYDENIRTDESGNLTINDMEFDNYHIEVVDANYDLAGSNPYLPYGLPPDTDANISIALSTPDSLHSLLVLVLGDSASPLATASARLYNQTISYDETIQTGQEFSPSFGHAFFENLTNIEYQLAVSLAGYEEISASVQISEDTSTVVVLNPI